jgi:thioredoxin reductase
MSQVTAPNEHFSRYLIIGAGPGGLQLGYFLQQAGADYLILERESVSGGFFTRYPRHRRLISLNKIHTLAADTEAALRWDWNSLLGDEPGTFPRYSEAYYPHADDMARYLADYPGRHELRISYDTPVTRIEKADGRFAVHAGGRLLHAECVIVATGWSGPNIPDIPGIELAQGYESVPTEGAAFTGKRVLIIGKGNSAFETAQAMIGHAAVVHLASPRPVRLAWNTKHPGDVRGQYGALLDGYWFKTLDAVLECRIDRLWRDGDGYKAAITYTLAEGEQAELDYDVVVRCTGFTMDTGLFADSCRPEPGPNGRLPALRPDFQSTNVGGLYFAGTLMQIRDFKGASSAFVHGFRYNLRTLAKLLIERYEDTPLERRTLPAEPGGLTDAMLQRVNNSSALWGQFEYLCDVYVVDGDEAVHYAELPEDYAIERFKDQSLYFTVTLRWGRQRHPDVFAIQRHPSPDRADECAFLHPVIRAWQHGNQIGERHLLEDLQARWLDPVRHVAPLREFVEPLLRQP